MKRVGYRVLKILLIILSVITVSAIVVGIAFAIYVDRYVEKSIDEELFYVVGADSETRVYYHDYTDRANRVGEAVELTEEELYGGYRCKHVSYDNIPEHLKNAFISIEDKRFESHRGVDWFRTLTAGINYFLKFSQSYGGSTITQQLIKNVTEQDDYSFQRKIQEIFWALDLETKMDKKEILERYLNIINLSQGCYGVGAAAEYYFSKDVSELTLSECACIAAITNSPTYYDPIKNPENNAKRRALILKQMYELGYIDEQEYNFAKEEEVTLNVKQSRTSSVNSWYVDMVVEDVMRDLMAEYGYSRTMASLIVYTGGLNIYTVMDISLQREVEEYYSKEKNFFASGMSETPQSAAIIIDSATGDVLAVAGAIGEKAGNRVQNFATDTVRPAGSVIKPLSVYAPALDAGIINWATVYDDTPVSFGNYNLDKTKGRIVEPVAWPKNSSGIYRGLTNINYAIEHSINTVTVKVLQDLGLDASFDFLYNKLNMKSLIESRTLADGSVISDKDYAALALGQFNYGVSVREITAAYSVFANDGVYNDHRTYTKVTDADGDTVLEKNYHGEAVIREENADIMTLMLKNVVENGTAAEISLKDAVECAGKTGTTQNKHDSWYIGYTPEYIMGVWFGYEYPKALSDFQGNRSLEIWDDIMTELNENGKITEKKFEISQSVCEYEYCVDSGKLATSACHIDPRGGRAEKGYFIKGDQPTSLCDRHVAVEYDTVYGGVVIGDCPRESVQKVGLIGVERSFPIQIYVTDAQYTWRDIGKRILPETAVGLPFYHNLLPKDTYSGISRVNVQYNRACREHFNYFEWKERQELS